MYKRYAMLRGLANEGIYVKSLQTSITSQVPEANVSKDPSAMHSEESGEREVECGGVHHKIQSDECIQQDDLAGSIQTSANTEMEPTAKRSKVYKSHKTSIVIIPPEDCWSQIQKIRSEHDKAYKRWMPHINMIYPFIPHNNHEADFSNAAHRIREGLQHVQPFTITFPKEAFGYFPRRKNTTMWLKPLHPLTTNDTRHVTNDICSSSATSLPIEGGTDSGGHSKRQEIESHPAVIDLQSKLVEIFPDFTDLNTISEKGFQPHLSLGQFKPKVVHQFMDKCQENWTDITFEVKEVYLISRVDFDDPFHIRHTVPLGPDTSQQNE